MIKLPQMTESVDHLLQNRHIARIVKKCAELLSIFVKQPSFSGYFQQNAFRLFIQAVLPYLAVTEGQKILIEEDPKEFFSA